MTVHIGAIVKIKHDTTASNRNLVKAGSYGKVVDKVRSTVWVQVNDSTLVGCLFPDIEIVVNGEQPWWMDYGITFDDHKVYTKSMRAD